MFSQELNLKEIQKESLKVLLKIKEIFDENKWVYYLAYGTLLGCVRNNGFIPWDDDIDLWVPREYYEKFINYCKTHKEELGFYELLDFETKNYPYVIARFSDSRFTINYNGVKNYGLGLFVDIYPLDEVAINDDEFKSRQNKMILDLNRICIKDSNCFKRIIKFFLKPIFLIRNGVCSKVNLIKKINANAQKYNGTNQDYLSVTSWEFKKDPFKKEWFFEKETFGLFEGFEFRIPTNYNEILKLHYGDYMKLPPKSQRIAHHFYKAYRNENN